MGKTEDNIEFVAMLVRAGLTYKEISARTGTPYSTVKAYAYRAGVRQIGRAKPRKPTLCDRCPHRTPYSRSVIAGGMFSLPKCNTLEES